MLAVGEFREQVAGCGAFPERRAGSDPIAVAGGLESRQRQIIRGTCHGRQQRGSQGNLHHRAPIQARRTEAVHAVGS
jgi:hypothetical protein